MNSPAPEPSVIVEADLVNEHSFMNSQPRAPTPTAVLLPRIDAYIADAVAATGTHHVIARRSAPFIDVDPGAIESEVVAEPALVMYLQDPPEPLPRGRAPRASRPPRRGTSAFDDDEDTIVEPRPPRADTLT